MHVNLLLRSIDGFFLAAMGRTFQHSYSHAERTIFFLFLFLSTLKTYAHIQTSLYVTVIFRLNYSKIVSRSFNS